MKILKKSIKASLDIALGLALLATSPFLILFSKKRSLTFPISSRIIKRLGFFIIPKSYYFPIFDESEIKEPLSKKRKLPGVNFNLDYQLEFLENFIYKEELESNYLKPGNSIFNFELGNGAFEAGDFETLYQFCRTTKPKRVVEIGSGHSTKVLAWALKVNKEKDNLESEHICIEPYENPWLSKLPVKVLRKKVEDIDISFFRSLKSGDLLFIDSSHVIRPQGDVLYEYLQIIPTLNKGVNVHVHDIFSPRDYLESFIKDFGFMWNEQYLLEALLSNGSRYKTTLALNLLKKDYFESLSSRCPWLTQDHEPGSFYFKII